MYFNLGGHGSGWEELKQHQLTVPHLTYTPDDSDYLPTGALKSPKSIILIYRKLPVHYFIFIIPASSIRLNISALGITNIIILCILFCSIGFKGI